MRERGESKWEKAVATFLKNVRSAKIYPSGKATMRVTIPKEWLRDLGMLDELGKPTKEFVLIFNRRRKAIVLVPEDEAEKLLEHQLSRFSDHFLD
jgi:hypothetical protein